MRWPMITMMGATICQDDGEAEGRTVEVRWLGWIGQFTVGRLVKVEARRGR